MPERPEWGCDSWGGRWHNPWKCPDCYSNYDAGPEEDDELDEEDDECY